MKLKQKLNNVQDFIPVKDIRYGIIETVDGRLETVANEEISVPALLTILYEVE